MLAKQTALALCVGLLGIGACAHDGKARERASVSAVTNQEVAEDATEPGNTRMHYTEVSEEQALGRDRAQTSTTQEPGEAAVARRETLSSPERAAAGSVAEPNACELAVYFDTDSARLDQSSQERLDRVAECMKRREVDHATIVGQTDPSGSAQHNHELGLERARVVAEYLRRRGVPEQQIRVRSKGELAAVDARELWPVDRRAGVDVKH